MATSTYKLEVRREILRRVLAAQENVRRNGPDPTIALINDDQLHEIRRIWRVVEEGDWEDSIPRIHREVTGSDLEWVEEDAPASTELDERVLIEVCQEQKVPAGLMRERSSVGVVWLWLMASMNGRRTVEPGLPTSSTYDRAGPSASPVSGHRTVPRWGSVWGTCSILTCAPNELVARIHNRMPVILPRDARDRWFDRTADTTELQALLAPLPANEMEAYAVSTLVNSPRNDLPECIAPVVG